MIWFINTGVPWIIAGFGAFLWVTFLVCLHDAWPHRFSWKRKGHD